MAGCSRKNCSQNTKNWRQLISTLYLTTSTTCSLEGSGSSKKHVRRPKDLRQVCSSVIVWVANHRKHHRFSDQEGDPHTPREGGFWSHMTWLFPKHSADEIKAHCKRWAPDLLNDAGAVFFHKTFLLWHFLIGGALLASGWLIDGPDTGVSWLLWGLAVRMVIVFHVTWFVNSATHIWGYRNYETTDDSRNLWWVGLLAFGEGWHNNHHKYQRSAAHGHKWWELDMTYWIILAMEKLGLAWNVVHAPRSVGHGGKGKSPGKKSLATVDA